MRLLILTLLVGCGNFNYLPRQGEAEAIVWHDIYGEIGQPPQVEWLSGADLNCSDAYSFRHADTFHGLVYVDNACLTGEYWSLFDAIQIALDGDSPTPFSDRKSFPHELLHAHIRNLTGNEDRGHLSRDFNSDTGLLAQAVESLKASGL